MSDPTHVTPLGPPMGTQGSTIYGVVSGFLNDDDQAMGGEPEIQSDPSVQFIREVVQESSGAVLSIPSVSREEAQYMATAAAIAIGEVQTGLSVQQQQLQAAASTAGEARAMAASAHEQMERMERSHVTRVAEHQVAISQHVDEKIRAVEGATRGELGAIQRKASEDVNRITGEISHVTTTVEREMMTLKADV